MAAKIKRFLDCFIPVTACNLRCHYCYITQRRMFNAALPKFPRSPKYMAKALSMERLGGPCFVNLCGGGETLLPPEMPELIRYLLEEGHYVSVVTNGTVAHRFKAVAALPRDLLQRLFFKFSFHFLELQRLKLMETFFSNIKTSAEAGCSYTVEIMANDELIPHIEAIKEAALRHAGALCHVTAGRKETDRTIPLLTELPRGLYAKVWGTFDSALFNYKMAVFGENRKEFCYAGDWSISVNMGTGDVNQCNSYPVISNIYKDLREPLNFLAIGRNCPHAHCFNSHAYLVFGVIPELTAPTYADVRNRATTEGTEWLLPEMKAFFDSKLAENNEIYSDELKAAVDADPRNRKAYIP